MYSNIRRTVSQTSNGTYRGKDWHLDFERLPWVQWLDIEPLTKYQRKALRLLYPILLQEVNTKKPSSLLRYLVGRGVLFWQDVVVIRADRQTDMEQNAPLLRIIESRGQAGYKAFIDGLRSRYGAWQGYLADTLEGRFSFVALRDMSDIYKIICHDIVKITPVGWSALPRVLGLKQKQIEKVRRENKLLINQVLHSLLLWTGHREDTDQLLNELLWALQKINRKDIANGIIMLLTTVQNSQNIDSVSTHLKEFDDEETSENFDRSESPRLESGISTLHPEINEVEDFVESELSPNAVAKGSRSRKSMDSGFAPSPISSRRSPSITLGSPIPPPILSSRKYKTGPGVRKTYRKTPILKELSAQDVFTKIQRGKVYSYDLTPRKSSNAWERRKPSILQMDYMTHPNHDNMFMDYLVYH